MMGSSSWAWEGKKGCGGKMFSTLHLTGNKFNSIIFPQVEPLLPIMVTGMWPSCLCLNPWAFSSYSLLPSCWGGGMREQLQLSGHLPVSSSQPTTVAKASTHLQWSSWNKKYLHIVESIIFCEGDFCYYHGTQYLILSFIYAKSQSVQIINWKNAFSATMVNSQAQNFGEFIFWWRFMPIFCEYQFVSIQLCSPTTLFS